MKIFFHLTWLKNTSSLRRGFKDESACELFEKYLGRISKFTQCSGTGPYPEQVRPVPGTRVWICERGPGSRILSSEDIAAALAQLQNDGVREWHILIGGPDGFSREALSKINPDKLWSFGSMTLPHELAAVVASEQVYRAWTINRNLPYHSGH